MLMRFIASFILISLSTTFNAYAENHDNGIKYNFAEIRLVDVDGGDGIEFGGSYRINQQFYAALSFQTLDLGPFDLDVLEISGGYIYPHKKIDFAFEVGLIDADASGSSESGFSLAAGGRSYVTPEVELRAYVRHVDVVNSDTFIELGGDYFLGENLSLGVTLELNSDPDTLTFGGRYYF
jgi:hypothetical protein